MLKRVGESWHTCQTPTAVQNYAVPNAAVEEDGTGGIIIEVFDDLDKVGV